MGTLAFFLLGIVTDEVATTALALTHHHFFDPQVVRYLLVATRALEDPVGHLVTSAHRHTQDVFTATPPNLQLIRNHQLRFALPCHNSRGDTTCPEYGRLPRQPTAR